MIGAHAATKATFVRAGNVAKYLGVSNVNAIVTSIPVNFIFLGFRNDGNLDLNLDSEELQVRLFKNASALALGALMHVLPMQRWFMFLEHFIPKSRIVDPHYNDEMEDDEEYESNREREWSGIKTAINNRLPVPTSSSTFFNVSCNVLDMGPRVTAAFERALHLLARPDVSLCCFELQRDTLSHRSNVFCECCYQDPSLPTFKQQMFQIDSTRFTAMLESFIAEMKLNDAYNIFIANPRRDPGWPYYGYRAGLSPGELELVLANTTVRQELLKRFPEVPAEMPITARAASQRDNRNFEKFSEQRMWTESEAWVSKYEEELDNIEKAKSDEHLDPTPPLMKRVVGILQGVQGARAAKQLRNIIAGGPDAIESSCLTDLFIGKERYAWVDLTAGPFFWGPAKASSGARTSVTLPNVEEIYKNAKPEELSAWDTSDELEEVLSEMALKRFENVDDEEHKHLVLEAVRI